jgi:hypothetical protein
MCRAFSEFNLILAFSWMDFELFQSFPSVLTLTLTHFGRIHELHCYALSLITVRKFRIYFRGEVKCINSDRGPAQRKYKYTCPGVERCGPWLPLATDFPHSVRDLYFGILAVTWSRVAQSQWRARARKYIDINIITEMWPSLRSFVTFRNMLIFLRWAVVHPLSNRQARWPPLVGCPSFMKCSRVSLIPHLSTRHSVVTGTRLTWRAS